MKQHEEAQKSEASSSPTCSAAHRPVWGLRDCWQCDVPVPMVDRDGSDISPDTCPHCGAVNPCGLPPNGPLKATAENENTGGNEDERNH
jgi:hypothetical protein